MSSSSLGFSFTIGMMVFVVAMVGAFVFIPTPADFTWDHDVTVKIHGNYTEKNFESVNDSINVWNKNFNRKINITNSEDADIDIYFNNRTAICCVFDGRFNDTANSDALGCAGVSTWPKIDVTIWVDDTSDITDNEYKKVVLHEICHGMGVPHLDPVARGVMGRSLHDPFGNSDENLEFEDYELEFIKRMYP